MRIGEVASVAGVSVRTLHHYDEIGLLRPSGRTPAGHRDYTDDDVVVLYRIVALRQLGLALEDIKGVLEGGDLSDTVGQQLDYAEAQFGAWGRLRNLLRKLSEAEPTLDDLIETMEATTMVEKHYTPEQLEFIRKNAEKQGPNTGKAAEAEWPGLIAAMQAHMKAGTDPSDPEVRKLGARWRELVESFTGRDPGVTQSLQNVYAEDAQRPESQRQFGWMTKELMEYVRRANQGS